MQSVEEETLTELLNVGSQGPWFLRGDFNKITRPEKYIGHSSLDMQAIDDFHSCIRDCHILELSFSGNSYTWSGERHGVPVVFYRRRALAEKMKCLKEKLKTWDKNTFENVRGKILVEEQLVLVKEIEFKDDPLPVRTEALHRDQEELSWHLKTEEEFVGQKARTSG
ncbi:hypothetical protein ACH5RR_039461 [Cinchona calisaya]|uniref:Uncharacterized protein n=1 Tax=Cinchona calisaya TaxID=153742 RepID=A0ABD2XYT3_9GENT